MHDRAEVSDALARHSAGATVSEVARAVGVPRRTVNDWVLGRLPTTPDADQAPSPPPEAYAYLLGLYLGDGWISRHPRGVLKLRLALDAAYPAIIDEAQRAIEAVLPGSRSNRTSRPRNCVEVYAYSRRWTALFPQHGPGKKHERRIELAPWQQRIVDAHPRALLRGLIQSDGCRAMNTGTNWAHPRYSFSNRSDDIRAIFTGACDAMALRWTTAPHTVYVSRKADVARMDEFIGPKR